MPREDARKYLTRQWLEKAKKGRGRKNVALPLDEEDEE